MTETLLAARVVTADAVHAPGWVRISSPEEGGRVLGVGRRDGSARPSAGAVRDLGDAILVPGFVDLHVHGGGGSGYPGAGDDAGAARAARAAHLACGTTTSMASLVTDTPEGLLSGVRRLAPLVAEGLLGGIHLEGPWLSPARTGAHDPALLRLPDPAEIDALLAAGGGAVRMVTIAPELPGALDAIRRLVDAGVLAAVGHTDADYATTVAAIGAGATVATHLFNAMRPIHHREPGPVVALMEDERVALELVADGVHLHPALLRDVEAAVGAERVVYVTDAMDAAARADGDYRLGALDVEVREGVARVAGTGTIAGGTATMDGLFRARALRDGGWDDASLRAAARVTAANPARVAGWDASGDIVPGRRADLVALTPELRVAEVILGSRTVPDISTSR